MKATLQKSRSFVSWVGHDPIGGAQILYLYNALPPSIEVLLNKQDGCLWDEHTICEVKCRYHTDLLFDREVEQGY